MGGADRLGGMVSEGRVKLHVFGPSGRRIWTVVGRGGEHWVDPDSGFCSCKAFYFGRPRGGCYHLDSAGLAEREGRVETVTFEDGEFEGFVAALVSGL